MHEALRRPGRAAKWVYRRLPAGPADRLLGLVAAVLHALLVRSRSDRAVVLCYHIVADRTGRALVPTIGPDAFAAQLAHLTRAYAPVPSAELRDHAARRRRGGRFPVAITFDDDHRSTVDGAAPVLRRMGVPATFFLTGRTLDGPHEFWWQILQRALDARGVDGMEATTGEPLAATVARITAMTPGPREAAAAALLPAGLPEVDPGAGLRRERVGELARDGLTVGWHTREHWSLPLLDDAGLEAAMTEGRAELEAAVGGPLREVAYPYGHHDERVVAAAAAAGFEAGYTVEARPVSPASAPHRLGRLEPGDVGPGRFAWLMVKTLLGAP